MRRKRSLNMALSAGPLLALLTGQTTNAATQPEIRESGNRPESGRHSDRTSVVIGPICRPFLANTKTVGVPIQVQDEYGQILTDLTGLTFELTDGTRTLDVTEYVGTSLDQSPVEVASNEYGNFFNNAEPLVSFETPGIFFLSCSPNLNDRAAVFSQDVTLKAFSQNRLVSSASLAGRAPVRHRMDFMVLDPDGSTISPLFIDAQSFSNVTLDVVYRDFLNDVAIPFQRNYATSLLQFFMSGYTNSNCRNVDVFRDGNSLSDRGRDLVVELMNGDVSHPRVELNKYLDDPELAVTFTNDECDIYPGSVSDSYLINFIVTQLLTVNGPKGEISSAIQSRHHSLRPASVLRPENPLPLPTTPTTTVVQSVTTIAPTTSSQPVATEPRLPRTGSSIDGTWLAAVLVAIGLGFVGIRRSRSTFDS